MDQVTSKLVVYNISIIPRVLIINFECEIQNAATPLDYFLLIYLKRQVFERSIDRTVSRIARLCNKFDKTNACYRVDCFLLNGSSNFKTRI